METDKKIEGYLRRAGKILTDNFPHGDNYGEFIIGSVEIAKMIQLEEHRDKKFYAVDEIPQFKRTRGLLEDLYRGVGTTSDSPNDPKTFMN